MLTHLGWTVNAGKEEEVHMAFDALGARFNLEHATKAEPMLVVSNKASRAESIGNQIQTILETPGLFYLAGSDFLWLIDIWLLTG